jgi:hypothetical protein
MSANGNVPERPRRAQTGLYVRSASGLKLRDRKVQRLVRAMRVAMPWLEEADIPTCRAWAQLEILADIAYAMLTRIGIISNNVKCEPRRLLKDYRQLRQAQLQYAKELGMTPAARMAIKAGGSRAPRDLAGLMANCDVEDVEPEPAEPSDSEWAAAMASGNGEDGAGNGPR